MKKSITLPMAYYGEAIFIDTNLWNKKSNRYSNTLLTFDTGAVVTTISKEILFRLGYDVSDGATAKIVTASGIEYVREVSVDRLKMGNHEINNVKVYAHAFPQECFSSGVIGLNVLSMFDINLLFSKRQIELLPLNN